jgi:hypothetical protein
VLYGFGKVMRRDRPVFVCAGKGRGCHRPGAMTVISVLPEDATRVVQTVEGNLREPTPRLIEGVRCRTKVR